MSGEYRLLLEKAALSHEKHEAGRQEPFNVFSVLRSESDEVNLHSRFLHALLNYRKPGEETRENLADFLKDVDIKDFEQSNVKVERERYNIDILIANGVGQAVVIENKIRATDRSQQLLKYDQTLKERGYCERHLLYLTPFGHAPSRDSVGDLEYKPISYKYHLRPWLKRCQNRAYDEQTLRESVEQYQQLVQKLTKEEYLTDLTELCLRDNNLVLIHDLSEAMTEAKVCLLGKLWCEIECALREEIPDLPPKDKNGKNEAHPVTVERIRLFYKSRRQEEDYFHGLFYLIGSGEAALSVEANEKRLFFGVRCHKDYTDERRKLDDALVCVPGELPNDWWPRRGEDHVNLKNPSREDLGRLANDADRKEHAKRIAKRLKPFWEAVKVAGLT